jgi:Arc/MetJ-type ribon-helix-helix transcriptional regulator
MIQLVTKVDERLASDLDELVSRGEYATRSDAVRAGLRQVIEESHRKATAAAIADGYGRVPETDNELEQARRATIAMIAEEPW